MHMYVISFPRRNIFVRDIVITAIIALWMGQLIASIAVGPSLAKWERKVKIARDSPKFDEWTTASAPLCRDREERETNGFYSLPRAALFSIQVKIWTAAAIKIRTTYFSVRKWMLCLVLDLRDNSINVQSCKTCDNTIRNDFLITLCNRVEHKRR